jgi:hypothetical protein
MFRPTPAALLRWATLYFISGVSIGIYMSITQDFAIMPVHAHVNLLGWVSLALAALIYKSYPAAAASKLAAGHFWISIVAQPVLLAMLYAYLRGNTAIEPVLGVASISVLVAVLLLVINVFRNVHD